jgi:outer membrane receptor protein involved in Fe transport
MRQPNAAIVFGSLRWRYFGPRTLIEDNTVQSKPTSLVNFPAAYQIAKNLKLAVNIFNLLNARDSDIDYFYTSRLTGEHPRASTTFTRIQRCLESRV